MKNKKHQAKLLSEIMKSDEELGIYSELKYCECLSPIIRTGDYCGGCGNDLR